MTDLLTTLPANEANSTDPLYIKCKEAVRRMIELLQRDDGGSQEMNKNRHEVLLAAYEHMAI